jgi:hypothetical protein
MLADSGGERTLIPFALGFIGLLERSRFVG